MCVAWMRGLLSVWDECGVSPLCGVDTGSAVWYRLSPWSLSSSEILSLGSFIDSVCSSLNEPEPHSLRENGRECYFLGSLRVSRVEKLARRAAGREARASWARAAGAQDSTLYDTEGWRVS